MRCIAIVCALLLMGLIATGCGSTAIIQEEGIIEREIAPAIIIVQKEAVPEAEVMPEPSVAIQEVVREQSEADEQKVAEMPAEEEAAQPEVKPEKAGRSLPVKIKFPSGTVSKIKAVGLDRHGAIATVSSATKAAWYEEYAAPGETGNCIINGHNRWKGETGNFNEIRSFEAGDAVIVTSDDGTERYYQVQAVERYPFDAFPGRYLKNEGEGRLTLITCDGDYDRSVGTSRTRVVVTCQLMW